ncbi:MAG TPA: ParB/RepB/Spo0J family partition protein [Actinomycetota bacterium]|nr:ParB/RepB/Spo0J family partition protein [Actinomycetota bacterium]
MTELKGGLGRGLSALLPHEVVIAGGPQLRDIAIGEIRPNARQPRTAIEDDALNELAASIRSVGLLQPVVVRPVDGGYELVAGERRWRACTLAGLTRIPAIIRETGDDQMLRDALIENLQRVDLNPLDEAAAFRQLVDDFGATHEEIAERVGKSRAAVTNSLRLLQLSPDVQQRIATGTFSAAHGRAIAALADHAAQARAAARVVADSLSVRQTEELVRTMVGTGEPLRERAAARRDPKKDRPAGILEAEMLLSDILGTRVVVESGRRRGRIAIEFADFDDLDRIVRHIGGNGH